MYDHLHSPELGAGLVGAQRHCARLPAGVEHVLGRGAEALKEGHVGAGGPPLSTGFSFFQVYGGPIILHLVFTDDLILE